ncbi:S8 family serine peptidase [Pontibacter cellulosilyticus]|uniref:S8 family serine peptidase n=1 Tax=Pontibacter cellulosilyticus TaxID=1720253 RepID=A0A923N7W1_9BACT|nr:S8 family serine peptidase [Pontibacter cellulosilyticus]MBC5993814.1 S8 family serine peptidase [Pontibacter cellulosilyticus]
MQNFYARHKTSLFLLLFFLTPFSLTAQKKADVVVQKQAMAKLARVLRESLQSNTARNYTVAVKDKAAFKVWLQSQGIAVSAKELTGTSNAIALTGVKGAQLKQLLNSPYVTFIDRAHRTPKEEAELKDVDFAANNIPILQASYPDLTGDGMVVSVKEGAFNPSDIDLKARVLAPESFTEGYTQHATTMATIIAGAGNSGPRGRGIATKAILATSSFKQLFPDNSNTLTSNGVGVQNHSYGVGVENYYGLESVAYDQQTIQNPQLLHVFSSGNSGDKAETAGTYANLPGFANLTGQFKNSKNTLSVGALEPGNVIGRLSSKGPAFDGRVKPELVAYGIAGTSEAAAVVSGVAVLVQQAYKNQYGGNLPTASLVKAALINSADDVGRKAVDFASGFGNTDALGAVRSILETRFVEAGVAQNEQQSFRIRVPEGAKALKVTLVWHDKEADPSAATALINDLDLEVKHIGTNKGWFPWVLSTFPHADSLAKPAKRGLDRLNNVEQITIDLPAGGEYELLVKGYKVQDKAQAFSLVYEYEAALEWLYPAVGLSLKAGEKNKLRWQGSIASEPAQLEYKLSQDRDWTVISEVNTADLYFEWKAPDTVAVAQLRLSTAGTSITTEPFILTKQLKLNVGFDCTDEAMVYWPALNGVKEYQLLFVDKAYTSKLLATSDTLAVLDKRTLQDLGDHILVAPIVEDMLAETSDAIAYSRPGTGCYIKSFLPEKFVMDTVRLNLQLSTLYQVASVTLERQQHGSFKAVQTLKPSSGLDLQLLDPAPAPGSNKYRVKVETLHQASYYSSIEEAVYTKHGYMQVYPNPVEAGQPLHIAVAGDAATLQLYDQLGKIVRESEEIGVVKTLDTTGLVKGLYILRVKSDAGLYISLRVVIL